MRRMEPMSNQSSLATSAESQQPVFTRTTLAVTIGNMLEFYDFITYSFFAIQIGHTFFPTQGEFGSLMLSLATFGAGFITRPIGGIVIGSYSDRAGRRPAMILSFAMMGCAIITLALTPSYASIGIAAPIIVIIARMVQGFSLGGEVGPTTAYLMESAAPGRRALAVSWQPASQQIAATAGALVGTVLARVMTEADLTSYGWRIAFLLGAACLPFGLYLRAKLPETVDLSESALKQAKGKRIRHISGRQWPRHCRRAPWRLARRPRRTLAGHGMAAARDTAADLSDLSLDRGNQERDVAARRLRLSVADRQHSLQRVLCGAHRRLAAEHPWRCAGDRLCGCDRMLRWNRTVGCHLAPAYHRQCARAGLVHAVRWCDRGCCDGDDAGNTARKPILTLSG